MSYLEELNQQKNDYYQKMESDPTACLKYQELEKLIKLESFLNKNNSSLKTCKIKIEIPCLYQGWEFDEWAWVIETETKTNILIITNHGSPRHLDGSKATEFLDELDLRYQAALDSVKKAKAAF